MTIRAPSAAGAVPLVALLLVITPHVSGGAPIGPRSTRGSMLLVSNGRWDADSILGRLCRLREQPERSSESTAAGARVAIAASIMGGKDQVKNLIHDLTSKLNAGTTFREPGTDGRLPAPVAVEMLQRWSDRLDRGRMTLIDLAHLERMVRSYYGDPRFLAPPNQMRAYLTLGRTRRRSVDAIPADPKSLWEFLRTVLRPAEFFVSGLDLDRDGQVDRWLLLGKDERGRPYACAPFADFADPERCVLWSAEQPDRFAELLKQVLFDPIGESNPCQIIARTVYLYAGEGDD
jgi:hypothetical protein